MCPCSAMLYIDVNRSSPLYIPFALHNTNHAYTTHFASIIIKQSLEPRTELSARNRLLIPAQPTSICQFRDTSVLAVSQVHHAPKHATRIAHTICAQLSTAAWPINLLSESFVCRALCVRVVYAV